MTVGDTLLLAGVGAAVVFVAVILVEGAARQGYDPVYHTGSELELGNRGWIQRANFLLMAAGVFAFAAGIERTMDTAIGAALLVIFGVGMGAAGVFPPDATRGYPPGAVSSHPTHPTWQHRVHHLAGGPVAFLALLGACLVLASRLTGVWRLYTIITAVAGLALTVSTALAYQRDAAKTGLVQRGLILVYWAWIVAVGIHLLA